MFQYRRGCSPYFQIIDDLPFYNVTGTHHQGTPSAFSRMLPLEKQESQIAQLHKPKHGKVPIMKKPEKTAQVSPILQRMMSQVK